MKCQECQFDNRSGVEFCEECGTRLEISCPVCSALVPLGRKFCGKCGCALEEQEIDISRSTVRESERKQVTVLFTDLSGYTAMTEKLDPEEVKSITARLFKSVSEIIYRYEGYIERVIGDEVMALFGYPLVHEDDPIRAVKAAINIHSMVNLNSDQIKTRIEAPVFMHTGINTGLVITGKTKIDQGQDGFAGDAINVAARLTKIAEADEILVGPETYKRCKDYFRFHSLGPTKMKGKQEPVEVYIVRGERNKSRLFFDRQIGTELVGRHDQMTQLLDQVGRTINGSGAIINLVGEAGIGKSRLIAELKKQQVMQGVNLLEGRAISTGQNLSFYPIMDFLKAWIGISEEDSEQEAFTKLENHALQIFPREADEAIPFLATLLGMTLSGRYEQRIKSIESESLDKLILKKTRDCLAEVAKKVPIVIIMEDFHWADQSSVEFMAYLFRLARTHRVLFINVFRPAQGESSDFISNVVEKDYPDHSVEIQLHPLDHQLSEELIKLILDLQGTHHDIFGKIVQRAGGNPLFIEEVLRSLIDDGLITASSSGYKISNQIDNVKIPGALQDILISRIDKLDEATRNLVKMASVIGRSFFHKIIVQVADQIQQIEQRLSYLKGIQLIRSRIRMEELEYLFKHALIQEAAYSTILHEKREVLHLKVASSIEKVFAKRLQEFYGMLAYHYSQGGDLEKSENYMILAGEQALKSSASSEALQFYQQALQIYTNRKGKKADLEKCTMLEKNIGLALFNRGRHAEAVPYFDKVLSYYGYKNPKHTILRFIKFLFCIGKTIARLYIPIDLHKKNMSQRDIEFWQLQAKKLIALSQTDSTRLFIESFYALDRVWSYDLVGFEYGYGILVAASGLFSYSGISFTLSRKLMEFGKDKYDHQDVRACLMSEFAEILDYYAEGAWEFIKPYNPILLEQNLSIGEIFLATNYIYFHGLLNLDRGNVKVVQQFIEQLHQISIDFENTNSLAYMYELKFKYLIKIRKFNEVGTEIQDAIDAAKRADLNQYIYGYYVYIARMRTLQYRWEDAEDALLTANEYDQAVKGVPCYLVQYHISAFLLNLLRLGSFKQKDDAKMFSKTRKNIHQYGRMMLAQSKKFVGERVQALRLMGNFYWQTNSYGKAMRFWKQSMNLAERLNARLELSRTYFDIAKHLSEKRNGSCEINGLCANDFFHKAETLFKEMSLTTDLDELKAIYGTRNS